LFIAGNEESNVFGVEVILQLDAECLNFALVDSELAVEGCEVVGGVDSFLTNDDEATGSAAGGDDEDDYFDRHGREFLEE